MDQRMPCFIASNSLRGESVMHSTRLFIITSLTVAIGIASPILAEDDSKDRPLWLRYPAVSPDGKQIAFTYGGQIWRVAASGGEAVPLTSGEFYSTKPVWSPDGQSIAFASKRHGNLDVFIMPATGGSVQRLTVHSADDLPQAFSPDGQTLYFSSARLGSPNTVHAGTYVLSDQLYTVPSHGGRVRLLIPTPALNVSSSPDGQRLLYENRPIYENEWRQGSVSDGARDIWLYDLAKTSHRKLTDFRGEDRNAVWAADGQSYYYLSEQGGTFNVWRGSIDGSVPATPVTKHETWPVRFLSIAQDGSLVYGYDGEIWRLASGDAAPGRAPIHISQASLTQGAFFSNVNAYASELAVSPDGAQWAVIARGEVFVMSGATGQTRRITSTPAFEASVSFGPDGHTLLYSSEREGKSEIFEARIADGATSFLDPGPINETQLIETEGDALQPAYSPDGRRIAYLDNRRRIRVFDRRDGKTLTVLPEGSLYSYQDGDMSFAWSPDGRWLTATGGSIVTATNVLLLDASGKQPPLDLSRSGYADTSPAFTRDGKAVIWATGRYGLRRADDNEGQFDVQIAFLTAQAHDAFQAALEGTATAEPKSNPTDEKTQADTWQPEIAGIEARSHRLTPFSTRPAFFELSPDNRSLVLVSLEDPNRVVGYRIDLKSGSLRQLFVKPLTSAGFATNDAGDTLYSLGPAGIEVIDLKTGKVTMRPITAEIAYDPRGEMGYLFDHFWRLTQLKFYEPSLHGVDWEATGRAYRKFLPYLHTWEDFADVLGEMAGTLNASHMGGYYYPKATHADQTASLGLYYDPAYDGAGLKILDLLPGGPADRVGSALRPGAVILAMDGQAIGQDQGIDTLLNHKAGVPAQLTVQPPSGGKTVQEVATPIGFIPALTLAKERWIAQRKALVESLSGGRLGYLYIEGMLLPNYQRAYSEVFGELRDKEGLVIDVRFNGGGNLHDQLIALFTGESVAGFTNRDGEIVGRMPINRWAKPSALLVNAGAYSDGSIFPHLYQRQKIGPLIGTGVPGTGTAVWWIYMLNRQIKYGIPQLGAQDFETGWFENHETQPDEYVDNDPEAVAAGRDPQVEAAVRRLLANLGKP